MELDGLRADLKAGRNLLVRVPRDKQGNHLNLALRRASIHPFVPYNAYLTGWCDKPDYRPLIAASRKQSRAAKRGSGRCRCPERDHADWRRGLQSSSRFSGFLKSAMSLRPSASAAAR
jgi:hypothetical protein